LLDFGQTNPDEIIQLELPIYREKIIYWEEKGILRRKDLSLYQCHWPSPQHSFIRQWL
jgi:hypothetical protein